MNILGIVWEENSTAALLKDGKVVACVSEERFSGAKNDERYPKQAIEYVLKEGGISPSEIDHVAFASHGWKPYYILTRRYSKGSVQDYLREQKEYWYPRFYEGKNARYFDVFRDKIDLDQYPYEWDDVLRFIEQDDEGVKLGKDSGAFFEEFRRKVVAKHLGIDPAKVIFVDHHTGHAAYAYYASPLRGKKLVMTADAWGDDLNATVSITGEGMKRIASFSDFLPGRLYRYITLLLGMKPNEHEYKVMGLAPYAKEKYAKEVEEIFQRAQEVDGLAFKNKERPRDMYFAYRDALEGKRFDAIAGGIQGFTESMLRQWFQNAIAQTGIHDICFGGGVAMNVKANSEINTLPEAHTLFIPPSPGDESQAMGAAYHLYAEHLLREGKNPDSGIQPLTDAYLGPAIDESEAAAAIAEFRKTADIKLTEHVKPDYIAGLLKDGKVIGIAQGRSEFGARALGGRSIIADPRNPDVVKTINEKIKNRDFWMPFACSILERRAHDYLLNVKECGAPYMTLAFHTTDAGKKDLRAGLHPYDMTCRPQILRDGQNPFYQSVIEAFERLTGVGGVLNTSFNLHGEPIIQTAKDALRVFKESDIDAVVINDVLIEKSA